MMTAGWTVSKNFIALKITYVTYIIKLLKYCSYLSLESWYSYPKDEKKCNHCIICKKILIIILFTFFTEFRFTLFHCCKYKITRCSRRQPVQTPFNSFYRNDVQIFGTWIFCILLWIISYYRHIKTNYLFLIIEQHLYTFHKQVYNVI